MLCVRSLDYHAVICHNDTANQVISTLEGKNPTLDGLSHSQKNATAKYSVATLRAGYSMFALRWMCNKSNNADGILQI